MPVLRLLEAGGQVLRASDTSKTCERRRSRLTVPTKLVLNRKEVLRTPLPDMAQSTEIVRRTFGKDSNLLSCKGGGILEAKLGEWKKVVRDPERFAYLHLNFLDLTHRYKVSLSGINPFKTKYSRDEYYRKFRDLRQFLKDLRYFPDYPVYAMISLVKSYHSWYGLLRKYLYHDLKILRRLLVHDLVMVDLVQRNLSALLESHKVRSLLSKHLGFMVYQHLSG